MKIKDYCTQWNQKFVSQAEREKAIRRKENRDEMDERKQYLPTKEEIKLACLEIQKNWSDEEREFRMRGHLPDLIKIC
jgi:hypothetical protein